MLTYLSRQKGAIEKFSGSLLYFCIGVLFAALATTTAYFAQNNYNERSTSHRQSISYKKKADGCRTIGEYLVYASFAAFISGILSTFSAFSGTLRSLFFWQDYF